MKTVIVMLCISSSFADSIDLQQKLIDIASQEAQIANIGQNKMMMLYGTSNAFIKINKWLEIEHKGGLTQEQIEQIKVLEQQKFSVLKVR